MYPDSVITTTKKGNKEIRNFLDYGFFIEYNYVDPETGKEKERKTKIILKSKNGNIREFFIIPTSDGKKYLLIPAEEKQDRFIWKDNKAESINDLYKEICEK